MYHEFFHLEKAPFSTVPDPSCAHLVGQHAEVVSSLVFGVTSRKGYLVLSGEAGLGKTTALGVMANLLADSNVQLSVIVNPLLTATEFMEMAMLNFGLRDIPTSKAQRLKMLEEFLIRSASNGTISALIVDEAHKLSPDLLEEVRLLGNLEDSDHKSALQIVLAGQEELSERLNLPELWQLKQRMAIRMTLQRLDRNSVEQFVRFRWEHAGGAAPLPFTAGAIDAIAVWSHGIPRLINAICDTALTIAFSKAEKTIEEEGIRKACMQLDLPRRGILPRSNRPPTSPAPSPPVPTQAPAKPAPPAPTPPPARVASLPPSAPIEEPDPAPRSIAPAPPAISSTKSSGARLASVIAGALIAAVGVSAGLLSFSQRASKARILAAVHATASDNNSPLQLQVEPQSNGQVNVRWNPQSKLIAQSLGGRLVITEKDRESQTVLLALNQLQFGHLTYLPQTDRVEFRLGVVDAKGDVVEESMLSLGTTPAQNANRTPNVSAPADSEVRPPSTSARTPKIAAPSAPAAKPPQPARRQEALAVTPPPLNDAPPQSSPVETPPVPAPAPPPRAPVVNAESSGAVVPSSPVVSSPSPAPAVVSPPAASAPPAVANSPAAVPPPARTNAPAPVPPAAVTNPPSTSSAATPIQVETNLQMARLVKRVMPVYPQAARVSHVQGAVRFMATIGKDGAVRNLELVDGPNLLRQAATDAVKQWKYRPTILNGQAVDVVTAISVNFTMGQ